MQYSLAADGAILRSSPLSQQPCGVADQRPPCQHAGLLIGDHRLHQLEVPDRGAALRRGGGVRDGFVKGALRDSDCQRGDVHTAARQRDHRGAVANVLGAADQRAVWNADIAETDVSGPRALLTHLGVLYADLDAGRAGGHQEDRDASAVLIGGPGAGEDDEQIGDGRIRDEALLAVDDPSRAFLVANGFRAQAGRIGSRARFGQCKRGHHLAR